MWAVGDVEVRPERDDLPSLLGHWADTLDGLSTQLTKALREAKGDHWGCGIDRAVDRDVLRLMVWKYRPCGKHLFSTHEIAATQWYSARYSRPELCLMAIKECVRGIERLEREEEVPDGASQRD